MNTQLLQQARVLSIGEPIEPVEAIWDGIVSRGAAPSLTEAQKTELGLRLADHLANPDDVVPWSEAKAAAHCQNQAMGLPVTFHRAANAKFVEASTWFAALVFATLPSFVFAQTPCPGIHVKILNIKNSTGTVACALFESADGFPTEYLRQATNVMVIKIRKDQARCDFEDIPPGTYAMAVVHDENMNGKLDTHWLGIPTEGYGFSNDAKGLVGAPSFSAASFSYDGQNVDMTMSLHY